MAKEMLLLGAGASVEAGVPSAYKMTEEILERFNDPKNHDLRNDAKVLNFVIGGLLFDAGKRNNNPFTSGVNVEDLFNAVLLLSERDKLEVSPFVGSWDSAIDAFDKILPSAPRMDNFLRLIQKKVERQVKDALSKSPSSSSSSSAIDKAIENNFKKRLEAALKNRSASISSGDSVGSAVANYVKDVSKKWGDSLGPRSLGTNSELDREFKQAVRRLREKPAQGKKFKRTADEMILMLKDLAFIEETSKVEYLKPILDKVSVQGQLIVATLNYDNAVELLSQTYGISCNTGIETWSEKGIFDFSSDGLHLIKLHGSIDWSWRQGVKTTERPMSHSVIRHSASEQFKSSVERPAVIFGQRNKLTAEGPFLDLLRQFQNALENCDLLTIVGYSLRDDHINTYVSKWLNETSDHKLRIVDPSFGNTEIAYVEEIINLRNTRPQQVEIIEKSAGEALATLYSND